MNSNLIYVNEYASSYEQISSEYSSNDRTPYTYMIGWKSHNLWYFGVRIAKGCHPKEFWIKYKTSSNVVPKIIKMYGDPDYVRIVRTFDSTEDALLSEHTFLTTNECSTDPSWLNRTNGLGENYGDSTGKILMTHQDSPIGTMIYPKDLELYLSRGWKRGQSERTKTKKRDIKKTGKTLLTDPYSNNKWVNDDDVEHLLSSGWTKYVHLSYPVNKGRKSVYHPETLHQKMINPEELEELLSQGYILGRPQDTKDKISASQKDLIPIHNPTTLHATKVHKEELDDFISNGYILGNVKCEYKGTGTTGYLSFHHEYTNEERRVHKDDTIGISKLEASGFVLGRSPEFGIKHAEHMKQTVPIYNHSTNHATRTSVELFDSYYSSLGYVIGFSDEMKEKRRNNEEEKRKVRNFVPEK